jgi:hypothetical protein
MKSAPHFLTDLTLRIEAAGQPAKALLNSASEIMVFGSRAAGVHAYDSDLDVLCFGRGGRLKTPALDLLWVPESAMCNEDWLGSELATHIAQYGICLRGQATWQSLVCFGAKATKQKLRRINAILNAVSRGWSRLHPVFRRRYQTTIRREIQRYGRLVEHVAVPPTPLLDREWQVRPNGTLDFIERVGFCGQSAFAIQLLKTTKQQIETVNFNHPIGFD